MTKEKSLFGAAMAGALGVALLCGAGAASAQNYGYNDDGYYADRGETVIVRPDRHTRFNGIQKRTILGRSSDGSINSTELSLSRRVNYADLNLSQRDDYQRLQLRVRNTARGICADLAAYDYGFRNEDSDRQCVNKAVNSAMTKVRLREG